MFEPLNLFRPAKPVTNCLDCPFHKVHALDAEDDIVRDVEVCCTKVHNRVVTHVSRLAFVRDRSEVPKWCPEIRP